jgi:hypothetical protein
VQFGGEFSGVWERVGNGLAIPSDDKPNKPRFVFEPRDDGSVVRHLEGTFDYSLWAAGGLCGGCDGGVVVSRSCANPF